MTIPTTPEGTFDIERARIQPERLASIVRDLRRPPVDYPVFNMDFTYFVYEDGSECGDIAAYATARSLGGPQYIKEFVQNGGDVVAEAIAYTGLSARLMAKLIMPAELLALDYPLHSVTRHEAAALIESFAESDYVSPDYEPLVASIWDIDGDEGAFDDSYTADHITTRVERFIDRYGGRR